MSKQVLEYIFKKGTAIEKKRRREVVFLDQETPARRVSRKSSQPIMAGTTHTRARVYPSAMNDSR